MTPRARFLLIIAFFSLVGLISFHLLRKPPMLAAHQPILDANPPAEDQSHKLKSQFEPIIIQTIETYIRDVRVDPAENTIQHAVQLDHRQGRPATLNKNYLEAYRIYTKVLSISYYHASAMGISISLNALANIFSEQGKSIEALKMKMIAYHVAESMNNPEETGVHALGIAGDIEKFNRKAAIKWRLKAEKDLRSSRYKEDYISLLINLADDYQYIGSTEKRNEIIRKAYLESLKYTFNPNTEWVKWSAIDSYIDQLYIAGQCEEAIKIINEHMPNYNKNYTAASYYLSFAVVRALCNQKLGNIEASKAEFLSTYAVYNKIRQHYGDDQKRAKRDRSNNYIINVAISTFLENNDYLTALTLLESNKARTLSEILGDGSQVIWYNELTSLSTQHENEIVQYFEDNRDVMRENGGYEKLVTGFHELSARQAKQRLALTVKMDTPKSINSDFLTTEKIRNLQKALPANGIAISYFVSNEKTSAIVIRRESIDWVDLGISPAALKRKVRELQIALQNPDTDFYIEPASKLYEVLIRPLHAHLKNIRSIVYSPDDLLSVLPLGTLFDGREFLAKQYDLIRFPSLRFFEPGVHLGPTRPSKGIACVDPNIAEARLPFQRKTGRALKQMYGENMIELAGAECNINNLIQSISLAVPESFLHIGAHGIFYPSDPMRSGIHLSGANGQSDYLDAVRLSTIDMSNFSLITLSSCETGLIDKGTPRDVFGITRALYLSGAKRIVSPLWSVEVEATSRFMQSFYAQFGRSANPASALRRAKTEFMGSKKFRHPFYWGAFTLVGGPT